MNKLLFLFCCYGLLFFVMANLYGAQANPQSAQSVVRVLYANQPELVGPCEDSFLGPLSMHAAALDDYKKAAFTVPEKGLFLGPIVRLFSHKEARKNTPEMESEDSGIANALFEQSLTKQKPLAVSDHTILYNKSRQLADQLPSDCKEVIAQRFIIQSKMKEAVRNERERVANLQAYHAHASYERVFGKPLKYDFGQGFYR